jgi:cyclohexanone monooxygenase
VLVVGAGFAGMYSLVRFRERGLKVRVFEAGDDVGGTWYWNGYPGARCDVESMEYSYSFSEELQQEWVWTERYSAQPEILEYAKHVAERFDLRKDMQFGTRVTEALWDESSRIWRLRTDDGATWRTRYVVWATGCLSVPNEPEFDGLEKFQGPVYHTGRWPQGGVDFSGLRVGVIGSGSSAIQATPMIAQEAKDLWLFQRTPNYSVPAQNHPLDPEAQQAIKRDYAQFREANSRAPGGFGAHLQRRAVSVFSEDPETREKEFEKRWQMGGFAFLAGYNDLVVDEKANAIAADFVRRKIREIVADPAVADRLVPQVVIGCRRLCIDTDYYKSFNRPNVHLVDVRDEAVTGATERGIATSKGEYELDAIVMATGFDAMTGALLRVDIRGVGGMTIQDKWRDGPEVLLGIAVAGFPNMFMVNGPGSPSVLSNMIMAIEHHVEWIDECIAYARDHGHATVVADADAERAWASLVKEISDGYLYSRCNSWWSGTNIEGKPRVFMAYLGFPDYVERCRRIAESGYEGFHLN